MSASNQKKLRKEQASAYMTERQRAEATEKKKLKRYTLTFWVIMALCVCLVIGSFVINPIKNMVYTNTDALTIGEHTLNAVTVNYFYVDAINQWYSSYGSYASAFGLDTAKPLNKQFYSSANATTWADYFLSNAFENIKSTYAVYDEAVKAGHTLTDDEKSSVSSTISMLDLYAQIYGYSSADVYLRTVYGSGATVESYRAYYEISALADSYYTAYYDTLEYTPEQLRAYEADKMVEYNAYTYAYYQLTAAKFYEGGTTGSDGTVTYTTEEKKAAGEKAQAVANAILSGDFETLKPYLTLPTTTEESTEEEIAKVEETIQQIKDAMKLETVEDFNTIIKALTVNKGVTTVEATVKEDILYGSVDSLYRDWIVGKVEKADSETAQAEGEETEETEGEETEKEEEKPVYEDRTPGEFKTFDQTSGTGDSKLVTGVYIVRFDSKNDNTYPLANVRHVLIKFTGGTYNSSTGTYTYTTEQKNAAKEKLQKLIDSWKEGEMTEETFIELANKNSEDPGSNKDGGLYEDVYPGQMVENFDAWCFEEGRKAGDYSEPIEGTDGYHFIYYVGDSETNYRDYMITEDMRTEDRNDWHDKITEAIVLKELNLKFVDKGMTLS